MQSSPHATALTIDIGGTYTRFASLFAGDPPTHLRDLFKTATPADPFPSLITMMKCYIEEHHLQLSHIGIAIAGQVDKEGTLNNAPNLHWSDLPFKQILQEHFHLPVHIRNDVQAATLAEWKYGSGVGCQNIVCLSIGTGIGGGIIANHHFLSGSSGSAGEIGHMLIEENNSLEMLAGGSGIAKIASESLGRALSAKETFKLAKEGNITAQKILDGARRAIVQACVNLVHVLNPEKIIFGGAVAMKQRAWLEDLEDEVRKKTLPQASKRLTMAYSALGENAPLVGALIEL